MNIAGLLAALPPHDPGDPVFPRRLLGAFRRKSITFCNGTTDEHTLVFWFQSRTFTMDLRLPDGAQTPLLLRQGWVGDTAWNGRSQEMSWHIDRSYQPHDQWPEPAQLAFIGNSVIEFAPSGAYVEDWRQQSSRGPLLGLRLTSMADEASGAALAMQGGLIVAGEHAAFAQSRLPAVDAILKSAGSLDSALTTGAVTEADIESYEVSVAIGGGKVTHSTQTGRIGSPMADGTFRIETDGTITLLREIGGRAFRLCFALDVHIPDFPFESTTPCAPDARGWMAREAGHLARHAAIAR